MIVLARNRRSSKRRATVAFAQSQQATAIRGAIGFDGEHSRAGAGQRDRFATFAIARAPAAAPRNDGSRSHVLQRSLPCSSRAGGRQWTWAADLLTRGEVSRGGSSGPPASRSQPPLMGASYRGGPRGACRAAGSVDSAGTPALSLSLGSSRPPARILAPRSCRGRAEKRSGCPAGAVARVARMVSAVSAALVSVRVAWGSEDDERCVEHEAAAGVWGDRVGDVQLVGGA